MFFMFFRIFVALLGSGVIRAVPNPQRQSIDIFKGNSVYPNYYVQHDTPFSNFRDSFVRAAFLPGSNFIGSDDFSANQFNRTNENENEKTYDEKTLANFAAAFGDKGYDKNGDKGEARIKAKVYSTDNAENVNVVNPFLAAQDTRSGKLLKSADGLPGVKAAKVGAVDVETVSFVNPFHGNGFDAVFGPEIAPRYEIRYAPPRGSGSFASVNPFAAANWNDLHFDFDVGLEPHSNAAFGPHSHSHSSWYPTWSYPLPYPTSYPPPFPPHYPSVFPSYPFPNPFSPAGYHPKGLKPKGKDGGGEKEITTESALETTSENFQDSGTSESSTEGTSGSTSESSSESSTRAPVKK